MTTDGIGIKINKGMKRVRRIDASLPFTPLPGNTRTSRQSEYLIFYLKMFVYFHRINSVMIVK